ncbi:MAG: hypothetical protein IKS17_07745 [Firmicutes bacterium]|nr:hypothetical protein [Bacillota bacterium]
MIKLYKNTDEGLCYAECWVDDDMATVHIGQVGTSGECWEEECANAKLFLKKFKQRYESEGYAAVPDSEMYWINITWQVSGGELTPADEEKIAAVYDNINEAFGWLGLGYADGFDTGENNGRYFVTLYALSVDKALGVTAARENAGIEGEFEVTAEKFG